LSSSEVVLTEAFFDFLMRGNYHVTFEYFSDFIMDADVIWLLNSLV